jgi:hypothetical protein
VYIQNTKEKWELVAADVFFSTGGEIKRRNNNRTGKVVPKSGIKMYAARTYEVTAVVTRPLINILEMSSPTDTVINYVQYRRT